MTPPGVEALLAVLLVAALANMVPLMLAAAGETLGEQSGVLNVGLEGNMLVGGLSAFAGAVSSGSFWVGFACGAAAGALMSMIMIVLSVVLGVNQIVVGIGLLLLGTGATSLFYDAVFAASKPRLGLVDAINLPWLSQLPVVGPSLFAAPVMLYVAVGLVALVSVYLHRTAPGLRLRVAGQRPASLDASGGSVLRSRAVAVLCGGALAGLGGAYLAIASAGTFTPEMTRGIGFLAIVVAMLGRGRLLWVGLISLGYGLLVAAGASAQLIGLHLPSDLVHIVPFIVVLLAIAIFGKRQALPPALAAPYLRPR